MSYQNRTHAVSICPWLLPAPASLMMEMTIVQILRQRMPPSASLRRILICTFHKRTTGIEMTGSIVNIKMEHCQWERLGLTENVGEDVQDCDGFENPILPQISYWCHAFDFKSISKAVLVVVSTGMTGQTYRTLPDSSRHKL